VKGTHTSRRIRPCVKNKKYEVTEEDERGPEEFIS
jgi:hypothetical protein